MIYTIDAAGIHYAINEHDAEERETDRLVDTQTPITQAEIDATIKRVSKEIEAMGYEQATA